MSPKILKIQDLGNCDDIISEASSVILEGGLVVYPTDTSYGLACDPRQEAALEKLVAVKRRDRKLGVPLLFSDLSQCETYHDFGNLERIIARIFWPGALTLVVFAKVTVPDYITAGRDSIAIRVPDHIIPRGIAKAIGVPIVGTSANRSGGASPFNVETALEQLGDDVELYIDGGPSSSSLNSTIIGVEESEIEGEPSNIKVYREGDISIGRLTEDLKVDSEALRFWSSRIVYPDR
jgi:tRNA threonylcarbamoyl adenosine modification protein (Sua5/YciO/YrdC/YwlC family)